MTAKGAVVFIGNSIFGDDAIGLIVGEALRSRLERDGFDVFVIERTGFALLDCLEGYESAFVVDSVSMKKAPTGKVSSFSADDFSSVKPAAPHYSGVPEAIGLMRDLGMPVPNISIIGINVRNPFSLSSAIDTHLDQMKDRISVDVYERIVSGQGAGC